MRDRGDILARCRQNHSIAVISNYMWTTLCLFVLMTQVQSQDVAADTEAESVRSSRDSNHVIAVQGWPHWPHWPH